MIDKRLIDDPAAAPDGLRRVLDQGTQDVATESELSDLARGVGAALGIPAAALLGASLGGAAASGTAAASKATSSLAGIKLAGLIAVGAALAGGGIAYLSVGSEEPSPKPAESAQPALVKQAAPAPKNAASSKAQPPSSAVQAVPEASAAADTNKPSARPTEPKSSAKPKPSESELLNEAHAALAKDPRRALTLTARHRKLYPNGVLSQEREVIEIDAMKRLGQKGAAQERASEFEHDFQASPYRRKIESSP